MSGRARADRGFIQAPLPWRQGAEQAGLLHRGQAQEELVGFLGRERLEPLHPLFLRQAGPFLPQADGRTVLQVEHGGVVLHVGSSFLEGVRSYPASRSMYCAASRPPSGGAHGAKPLSTRSSWGPVFASNTTESGSSAMKV